MKIIKKIQACYHNLAISDLILLAVLVVFWYLFSIDTPKDTGATSPASSWLWLWFSVELPNYLWVRASDGSLTLGVLSLGLLNTLKISFFAAILAFLIGFLAATLRLSSQAALAMLAKTYVGLARNLPPLVFLFILHFFFTIQVLPILAEFTFMDWADLNNPSVLSFISAVLALGLYEAPYVAEILRGGVIAVPQGQWQAAASLGLPWHLCLLKVIMPQAFRHCLPALTSQLISLIKDSSILSAISIQELSFQGSERMASTYKVNEIWLTVALLYLAVNLLVSVAGRSFERSFKWNI